MRAIVVKVRVTARIIVALGIAILCQAGCANQHGRADASHVILFVPGAGGDGGWYGGLKRGLIEARPNVRIETVSWGAPLPLFFMNFSDRGVHDGAERKLRRRIEQLAQDKRIDVVAHSAGCGVALGAVAMLRQSDAVRDLILLQPSVSPTYDLAPALANLGGRIHVFHSDRDRLFLAWRTSTFGTYDNVKTEAAGHTGFDVSQLPPELSSRIVQHPYETDWRKLGNAGDHDGPLARRFVERIVAPLIEIDPIGAPPVTSSRD